MKVRVLTAKDLAKLLKKYEAKYGMDTQTFAIKYNRGELPEKDDFFHWISYYDMAGKAGLINEDLKV